MKKQIAKLIDLKSIITMIVTGGLIYGFIVGKINAEQFMTIATMIFTFYFAKKEKGEDIMATTDTRTEEEIKEQLKKDYQPVEVEEKKEEE